MYTHMHTPIHACIHPYTIYTYSGYSTAVCFDHVGAKDSTGLNAVMILRQRKALVARLPPAGEPRPAETIPYTNHLGGILTKAK